MNLNSAFMNSMIGNYRRDVLDAAWKLTAKRGKTADIDTMRGEDVERSEGGGLGPVEANHRGVKEKRFCHGLSQSGSSIRNQCEKDKKSWKPVTFATYFII